MWKKHFEKLPRQWGILLFSVILLTLLIVAVSFLFSNFRGDNIVSASGRQHLDFRVFYLDNDIFGENPIPHNLDFLMSYTDYIEIDSGFTANFSEETAIYYSYLAEKRLVFRHMGTADANLNRIVYEEIFTLSEASGEVTANRLYFEAENNGEPGGSYTIFSKEHVVTYLEFLEDQARQMEAANMIAQGFRGFSAELWVDFTYTIYAPEFVLSETLTHGYRFSLSTEVYSFVVTGTPNFEWENNLTTRNDVTLPIAVLFVTLFTASVFGLLYTIKMSKANPNKYRQEADDILKKYAYEIVAYDKPVDLTRYEPMVVQEFGELLKLAINLNKHIMCYRDEVRTEFVVIVDGYACLYMISYNGDGSGMCVGIDDEISNNVDQ